jgi:hypothetical protein
MNNILQDFRDDMAKFQKGIGLRITCSLDEAGEIWRELKDGPRYAWHPAQLPAIWEDLRRYGHPRGDPVHDGIALLPAGQSGYGDRGISIRLCDRANHLPSGDHRFCAQPRKQVANRRIDNIRRLDRHRLACRSRLGMRQAGQTACIIGTWKLTLRQ